MAQPVTRGPITESAEWQALQRHFQEIRDVHLRELFGR